MWATRAFLGMTGLFVLQLCLAGIAWPLALLYTTFMIIGFVVLSRTIAETGLIYLKCYFWPCVLLYGLSVCIGTAAFVRKPSTSPASA